jgi:hypothetical protein
VADDRRDDRCEPGQHQVPETEGAAVKLTVVRTIPLTIVVAVICFALSGVPRFKNAHHGVDAVVGDIVWFGFLAAALATLVLAGVALYRRRTRRDSVAAHS